MPRRYDRRWQRYAESVPLQVEDGVATSKQRGEMASQWWSKQFIEVLESYGLGARMQRGRRYARAGQVMTLEIEPGLVVGQVQGSRATPYLVTVRLPEMDAALWHAVDDALSADLTTITALLSGEVPPDLVDVFAAAGVELFPQQWADLRASCNCPDAASPCKHLAAVLYVMADKLDVDPWLLLAWRGRTREAILDLLRGDDGGEQHEAVAPWWPFTPGPVPESVLFDQEPRSLFPDESEADFASDADDPDAHASSALDRLDAIDIDILGTPLRDVVSGAYPALIEPDTPAET